MHEINQVVNAFSPLVPFDFKYEIEDNKVKFIITIDKIEHIIYSEIIENDIKKTIIHKGKNVVYDCLSVYCDRKLPWGSHTGVRPVSLAIDLLKTYDFNKCIEVLCNEYRMSKEKATLATKIANHQLGLLNDDNKNIDIYISIPFCVSRCTYCSFSLIGIEKKKHLHKKYIDCILEEIEMVGSEIINNGYKPRCIYVGGGTPSAISSSLLNCVLEKINKVFKGYKEFTVEAGRPDTIDQDKLKVIIKNNVDRISINPQSMNQTTLDKIGRNHKVEDIITAYNLATSLGIKNINMDIIAGLPGEDFFDFKNTIDEVLKLNPASITIHSFALKRSSALTKSNYELNRQDIVSKMLQYAYEKLDKYTPYYLYRQKNMEDNGENVGFAIKNHECIYNIDIMQEDTHILALGSGGVSKRIYEGSLRRISDPKDIEVYIDRINETIKKNIDFFK